MAPPSSGGTTVGEALNILEGRPFATGRRRSAPGQPAQRGELERRAGVLATEAPALEARGHAFTSLVDIGAATAIALLGEGRMQAVAEPTRRGGGSAAVVTPGGAPVDDGEAAEDRAKDERKEAKQQAKDERKEAKQRQGRAQGREDARHEGVAGSTRRRPCLTTAPRRSPGCRRRARCSQDRPPGP